MAKISNKEIVMTKDGFFIGHILKNGKLSKGAQRINEDTIMKMFMHMFSAYCAHNNTDRILIKEDNYTVLVTEIPTENGEQNP